MEHKITYKIIVGYSIPELQAAVNKEKYYGWTCTGGITMVEKYVCQAMEKEYMKIEKVDESCLKDF